MNGDSASRTTFSVIANIRTDVKNEIKNRNTGTDCGFSKFISFMYLSIKRSADAMICCEFGAAHAMANRVMIETQGFVASSGSTPGWIS